MTESPFVDSGFAILVFSPGDDPISCLNKAMAFLMAVASSSSGEIRQNYSSTGYKSNATSSGGNNASGQARVVKCYNCQGEGHMARQCTQPKRPQNAAWYKDKAMLTEYLDTYDSDCDDISNAKAVLMANISNYGFDVISEVPHSETCINDMENQNVHAMQDFEQPPAVDFSDNKIHKKANKEQNNESLTVELERYKERVKTFEQRLNIDLSSREKMIDSQMDYMIKEKLALKEQVDSLEQNLSKQIKEKECLLQTFTVFKSESKEKEDKYMENKIDLEKKIKELDNILFKWIKPTLYDGIVMSAKHVTMHVIDDEENLILEEESRSKISEKAKDLEVINKNISHKPIDYEKLNRLSDDFGKRFTPQQELSAEQAFWLRMSNPTSKPSDASPVKIKAPKELPKVSLVNESLKKLKFHLARFDNVVKIRTTPDAHTEGEWGFEHTKAVFNNEIIPFLKSLKDIFNVFDRDLLNEIMEVKTVFDQMDAAVQQSSVDKQCLEIAKKELLLENDRLLQQIMSQDVLLTVMNSMSLIGESVNMDGKRKESCNLEVELLKSQNALYDLLKSYSQLEKHCISLEFSIQLNQEIFQKDEFYNNHNALEILEFFENNDLKARLQENDSTIFEQAKAEQPLDKELDYAYKHTQRIQELHVYVRDTCPNAINLSAKNVNVTPKNKVKKVRSKTTSNKRNDRISQTPSRNMKNKVEAQPRKVNKKNSVVESIHNIDIKHSLLNENSKPICVTCKKSMFDGVHDMCYVFIEVGLKWKPIGKTFTIVGNSCSLTRITSANVVPPKKTTSDSVETQKPELKVYSRLSRLFSACALGKSKKSSHQPKAEDTNREKLYLLHMDLCGLMRVASINGKWHILVIVDDYSRFTWVRFLMKKDEAPEAIIKCIKNIQVRLNAIVLNVRIDNGTEFVNQTLRDMKMLASRIKHLLLALLSRMASSKGEIELL
ncbi:integrase, catalytic region, zinc finger, CCHC-type containing protein [Tanacetum coccineum]